MDIYGSGNTENQKLNHHVAKKIILIITNLLNTLSPLVHEQKC